ncbi:hypothetical protein D7S86_22950 [Pararobbsia silviterrae]|uniref:Uncharacterized protein n=1 Tax=Pararobbsia silviterrae TaxID=1792498 RepID=A0A494XAN3_9BURK|nr:hypothetical protein D7S86_22950 [Pararobbsia silviterrae]
MTFDDVSQVAFSASRFGVFTAFNFVAGGRHEYAVQMRGKVRVAKGMTVTALLTEACNWQTVTGWVDHATGRIVGVPPIWVSRCAGLLFCALFVSIALLGTTFRGAGPFAIGMDIAFGLPALIAIIRWRSDGQVWHRLDALRSGLKLPSTIGE